MFVQIGRRLFYRHSLFIHFSFLLFFSSVKIHIFSIRVCRKKKKHNLSIEKFNFFFFMNVPTADSGIENGNVPPIRKKFEHLHFNNFYCFQQVGEEIFFWCIKVHNNSSNFFPFCSAEFLLDIWQQGKKSERNLANF